jgi:chemotaxis protein MotB
MSDIPQAASSEGGAPEWMVSYADMITIVMAFFVVLYATTSGSGHNDKGHEAKKTEAQKGKEAGGGEGRDVPPEQLQRVFDSLYDRFGPKWTVSNCWVGGPLATRSGTVTHKNRAIDPGRGRKTLRGTPRDCDDAPPEPGKFLLPNGRVYFEEGAATFTDEGEKKLASIAEELAGKMQKIELRGHTTSRPLPPDSPFRNLADLAYARCRNVEDYLVSRGVDARRIRLCIAAEREPLSTKADPLEIKQNSRVEIRLLNEWIQDRAGSGEEAKQVASTAAK